MARAPEDSPKEAKGEGEIPRMGDSPGKGHTILSRGALCPAPRTGSTSSLCWDSQVCC